MLKFAKMYALINGKGEKEMKIVEQILADGLELKRKPRCLYGKYKGFNILAYVDNPTQTPMTFVIRIGIKSNVENYKEKINDYFDTISRARLSITYMQANDFFCEIHITNGFSKKVVENANEFITDFIDFLSSEGFESGCYLCGKDERVENYEYGKAYCALCEDCMSKIQSQCEEEKATKASQKSNAISGTLGALIGSLIGVALWIVIYKMGYIASLAGLATVICAMKGYEKLGKFLDKKGVIISTIISIIMIYVANQSAWTLEIIELVKAENGIQLPFIQLYMNLIEILNESDAISSFIGDLVMGYLLSAIAVVPYIKNVYKNVSEEKEIIKLD